MLASGNGISRPQETIPFLLHCQARELHEHQAPQLVLVEHLDTDCIPDIDEIIVGEISQGSVLKESVHPGRFGGCIWKRHYLIPRAIIRKPKKLFGMTLEIGPGPFPY